MLIAVTEYGIPVAWLTGSTVEASTSFLLWPVADIVGVTGSLQWVLLGVRLPKGGQQGQVAGQCGEGF